MKLEVHLKGFVESHYFTGCGVLVEIGAELSDVGYGYSAAGFVGDVECLDGGGDSSFAGDAVWVEVAEYGLSPAGCVYVG